MSVDSKQLMKFLIEANLAGYASKADEAWPRQADGSTTITYQNGPWSFHDNYFGGEPYGGREIVFYQDHPVFIMVYYGRISDKTFAKKDIYSFLRQALKLSPAAKPFRGPKNLEAEIDGKKMKYENNWQGEIEYFSGEEKIYINNHEVYDAKYAGGLVDQ